MDTNTVVWIIVAVVAAIVLIALLVFVTSRVRTQRRRVEAERIRKDANEQMAGVEKREALADETAARARAARAEAEAKAAEAARLEDRANTHRGEASETREQLEERMGHADRLDPTSPKSEDATSDSTARGDEPRHAQGVDPADVQRR